MIKTVTGALHNSLYHYYDYYFCRAEQSAGFNPGLYKHYILLPALEDSFFNLAFTS